MSSFTFITPGAAQLGLKLSLAGLVALSSGLASAQTSNAGTTETVPSSTSDSAQLPSVEVVGSSDASTGFNTSKAPQVSKSSTRLAETPQSITVVPRTVLDSQQAQSLADALNNVPGVVSNQYGRRGWDDLIIRGQVASGSLYLDGLRTSANNRVAEQLFGFEQIEVLKGPASLLYGVVLPGGLVNMVSKRPQAEAFANTDVTIGSHDLYQATVDMGTPLTENGKAAFRINGLIMNSNDATDYVWYRDRYVAPSLSLDFGARTDFTILTSYQERSYIRQQGLPVAGSVQGNRNGALARSLFIGEPNQTPYVGQQSRIGYALTHRFDNGWTVNNNFRWQQYALTGMLVSAGTLSGRRCRYRLSDQ
jgi:iron complex outermembrane receptor protein